MGSNLLVADEGVRGAVLGFRLLNRLAFDGVSLTAGAGATNSQVLKAVRSHGLAGVQCLVGFPGTLGGAVRMNAGGRPGYLGARVEWVRGVDSRGEEVLRTGEACGFRYRGSDLGDLLVTEVRLRLEPGDPEEFGLECGRILREKRVAQPLHLPSAGCIWKNPPAGESAGRLVERAGLKGTRVGGAEVSPLHGNFIVNRGEATCADVLSLMGTVRRRVLEETGVLLEQEVIHWNDAPVVAPGR